jgi:TonB-linked SusC/RagA family outer membrane protein
MKRTIALLFSMLLLQVYVQAQDASRPLTGTISSADDGTPLAGVNITVKGSSKGTTSDNAGKFRINGKKGDVLVFTYVGHFPQEISVDDQTDFSVKLTAQVKNVEDVVVIGYGTQKKSSVTGAVAKFKNERLDEIPVARLDQALQGKMAGVQIQNLTSEAGAAPKITIRGISSINAGTNPLVVVDGHPVPDGLSFVNPADVESVEVLKDAASAAIYGSRGASGVILITTKSGVADKPKYNVKISSGMRTPLKTHPMLSVSEYTRLMFDEAAMRNNDPTVPANQKNLITAPERAMYVIEQQLLNGQGTDWQDEALRSANLTNIQLGVSGGKKEVKYSISGSYQKEEAMIYHSSFERFTLRAKMDVNLGKRVKMSFNLNPSYTNRERPSVNYTDFYRFYSYIPVRHTATTAAFVNQVPQWANIRPGDWAHARHFNNRVYSGNMPDGSFWNSVTSVLPFNTQNNTPKSIMETRTLFSTDYRMLSTGDITVNLLPGLDFKSLVSAYAAYTESEDFTQRNSSADGQVNRGVYGTQLNVDLLNENTLTYNKRIKKHSFNLLAGFTAQKTTINQGQTAGQDFPSDQIRTLNTALQLDQASTFTSKNQIGLLSVLGRVNYTYDDKYIFSASYRTDGSSYFAPGRKWGNFPSVSLGWVVSKEKFMDNIRWMNLLKLRGSYGATGNNSIVDFAWIDLLFPDNYAFGTGTGTVSAGSALSPTILSNPNITWERTFANNFGIDMAFMNNRFTLSVDMYQSETERLLLQQAAMGFTGVNQTWNNIGRLKNNGLEIEFTSNNVRKRNFNWKTTGNISFVTNKLMDLGGEAFQLNFGERNEIYRAAVGNPLVQFFGYKTDGVWLSQADVDAARAKDRGTTLANYFVPGGLKLVDINGDGKIDPDDRTIIGSPIPDFSWGVTNTINFRQFDLSFMFQGVQGVDVINGDGNYNESRRINRTYIRNRWVSAQNPGDGKTPYFTNGFNWMLTDYVVEDASYAALRELTLGFTLPPSFGRKARISSMRLYCSVQNAFVWMANSYRGLNPEARLTSGQYSNALISGYQRGVFPMPRTVMFGLDLNF